MLSTLRSFFNAVAGRAAQQNPLDASRRVAEVSNHPHNPEAEDRQPQDNAKYAEYAALENNHILIQLLDPGRATGEDPIKLAQRNSSATESSFGTSSSLHMMALNTLAFAITRSENNLQEALSHALAAIDILKTDRADDELMLESRLIAAQARIKLKTAPSVALLESFGLGSGNDITSVQKRAGELISNLLVSSVHKRKLERLLVIICLREVSESLIDEVQSEGLREKYSAYLSIYW